MTTNDILTLLLLLPLMCVPVGLIVQLIRDSRKQNILFKDVSDEHYRRLGFDD